MILLIVLLAATSVAASADTLRIKVIDLEGKPVDGATVVWTRSPDPRLAPPRSLSTWARNGLATFSNVLPGVHVIRVSAPGHLAVTVSGIVIEERVVSRRPVTDIVVLLNPIEEER
jgi:protocatechuate 3,4-dioxygenase beta subunit